MKRTIPNLLRGAVEDSPDKVWLRFDDHTWTFSDAHIEINRVASALRALGAAKGDRVLVTARNEPRYLFTWLALMDLGAIEVPTNPSSTHAELSGLIAQVRPPLIVTDSDLWPTATAAAGTARVIDVDELLRAPPEAHGSDTVDPGDPAVMIPTSGTTGRSKLVVQTHRSYVLAGEGFPWWLGLTPDDRLMTSLPLFHINAPAYSTLGSVAARAGLILLRHFSASTFIDDARRHGATQFNSIGAMLEILMRLPTRSDDAENPLRLCYTGPSPTRERQLEMEARFGLEIVCGYALSESPYGLIWRRGERPYGSLGSPRQHPELGHVNDARVIVDGRTASVGDAGELELRNPAIMTGYFEMPDETAAVLDDGWLSTGDIVTVGPDDVYTFVAREKEVIRRRGENLSPIEVEACLEAHPHVDEAAVVGVASDLSEQEVKAFVVPAADTELDVGSLDAHARAALAPFKVPRYYELIAELPHTPTGRISKHHLPLARSSTEVDMDNVPATGPDGRESLRTWIGSTTSDRITVAGRDLPTELMGHVSMTELAFLLIIRRMPTREERMVLDAVLVSLADHGLTPSALSARLTYTGAPEAVQGAVAAGLLGAGSVFLGPAGDTAQFLADALLQDGPDSPDRDDATLERIARRTVEVRRAAGSRIPGLGHPVHREEDPRTPRLYELAAEAGTLGPHLRLLRHIAAASDQQSGRHLPINGAGAAGAALADVGLPPAIIRGFVLIARTAGLVAHIADEIDAPLSMALLEEIESRTSDGG